MMVESFQQASRDPMFWASRIAYGPDQVILIGVIIALKIIMKIILKIIMKIILKIIVKIHHENQGFLKRYLWPWGKWSAVSHDSYSCQV